ncbi:MAG: TonB-dependent receptor, partial [Bacteroidetes bacterium]|nr:TonB-dependent receptor [Bacteroidota bacterium]
KGNANLKEVVVSSRKPLIEVRAEKTVLNIEGSVNAVGQNALELLRKSPGVMVDKDDNLGLSGKNGVQVYVDGRQTPLSGKDLSEYLKTIQSGDIESIEIISNPSAKYDAAGNAGIINIRLKKNRSFGTNGTITAGYNQGFYPKFNGGFSLNHRNKKVNLFGNYNYNNAKNRNYINLHREQLDTLFDAHTVMVDENHSHTFKAGMDYFINKRSTVGLMVNGTLSNTNFHSDANTMISYIPTGKPDRMLVANNVNDGKRNNGNLNLNYRYADTAGRELNMDADYGIYRIRTDQLQPNSYFDPTGQTYLYGNAYNMLAPNNIDIYSFKADYEQPFKKGKLGFGGKTSFVKSDNTFTQYNVVNPTSKIYDSSHSNSFNYRENINALYVNYNRPFKSGWMVQLGVRMENTRSKGTSTGYQQGGGGVYKSYDSVFKRNYTDFFPSGAITYNKNPMKQWSLTYSRRIDRPAYQDLNPFEFKLDEYTFQKGNTQLRPQYTNSVGLTYMYKFKLTTTLNYSHVKDVFTQLVDTTGKSKAFINKKNLATQDITSLNISYPFSYKWYSVFVNLNAYYSAYKADFGSGRTVNLSVWSLNAYAQNTLKLGKGWTGEVTAFYTAPSIWQGTFKSSALGSVDAGLSKLVFKGKGTVKASVSDIFKTLQWAGTSNFAGQYLHASGGFESRQLKLFFTYRFGNNQVRAARQRKTGSDDENKRVGSQGGGLGN